MIKPERNHPLIIVKKILCGIVKEIIILFLVYSSLIEKIGTIYTLLIIVGLIIIYLIYSTLNWYNITYYFRENSIFYKKGIVIIAKREVPLDKINTIDISQGIFERVFNLSKIKIDAGTTTIGAESEITLLASQKRAVELRERLLYNKNIPLESSGNKSQYKISFKDLFLYSLVSNSVFQGVIILLALYNFFDDIERFLNFNSLDYIEQVEFNVYTIIAIILMGLIICLCLSLIKICLKYAGYRVYVEDNGLNISYGLINKKNYSFDRNKIKGIHIKQNLLMQLINRNTIEIESVGYGDEGGEKAILYPFCNDELKTKIIDDLLPEFKFENEINKVQSNTYIRFILIKLISAIIITGVLSSKFKYGYISFLLIVLAFVLGHMQYKNSAMGMSDKLAYLSYNGFFKEQSIVKVNAIQSIKTSYSFFQKRKGICNYSINIWGKILGQNIIVKNLSNRFYETYVSKL